MRRYWWSSAFAWGLTLSGALLSAAGVLAALVFSIESLSFAAMMLFAIGCTNVAAEAAIQAMRREKIVWAVFLPAAACAGGFAFAANLGIHLGWEAAKHAAPNRALLPADHWIDMTFYFLSFAKPAMAWIIEGRKSLDRDDARAAEARAARAAANSAAGDQGIAILEDERERRANSREGWPPITQDRVDQAVRALGSRGEKVTPTGIARELKVGKDRVFRALGDGAIRLPAAA